MTEVVAHEDALIACVEAGLPLLHVLVEPGEEFITSLFENRVDVRYLALGEFVRLMNESLELLAAGPVEIVLELGRVGLSVHRLAEELDDALGDVGVLEHSQLIAGDAGAQKSSGEVGSDVHHARHAGPAVGGLGLAGGRAHGSSLKG